MATRFVRESPSAGLVAAPAVRAAPVGESLMEALITGAENLSTSLLEQVKQERVSSATAAGARGSGVTLRRDGTLAGQAYDKAVIERLKADTEWDMLGQVETLRNRALAGATQQEVIQESAAMLAAHRQSLDLVDPALSREMTARFGALLQPINRLVFERDLKAQQEARKASEEALLAERRTILLTTVRGEGLTTEMVGLAIEYNEQFQQRLIQMGPRDGFELPDYRTGKIRQIPPDPNRLALFSPAAIQESVADFQIAFLREAFLGEVQNRLEAGNFSGAAKLMREADKFLTGELVRGFAQGSEELVKNLRSQAGTLISQWQEQTERSDRLEEAERKDRWRRGETAVYLAAAAGTLTQETLDRMVELDQVDPDKANSYRDRALRFGDISRPARSLDAALLDVQVNLYRMSVADIANDSRLSRADAERFMRERTNAERAWRSEPDIQQGVDVISAQFGFQSGTNFLSLTDTSRKDVQDGLLAVNRYFRQLEKIPDLATRIAAARPMSEMIAADKQLEIAEKSLRSKQTAIAGSKYGSEAEIRADPDLTAKTRGEALVALAERREAVAIATENVEAAKRERDKFARELEEIIGANQ